MDCRLAAEVELTKRVLNTATYSLICTRCSGLRCRQEDSEHSIIRIFLILFQISNLILNPIVNLILNLILAGFVGFQICWIRWIADSLCCKSAGLKF